MLYWWLPLLIFPGLLKLLINLKSKVDPIYYDLFFSTPKSDEQKEIVNDSVYYIFFDFLVIVVMASWLVISSIICYKNIGSWWAILVGLFIAFVANVFFVPLRWSKK